MEFQSSLRSDGAPAPRDAVICFPSLEDSPGSLTKEHQPDVSNPYGPGTVDPRDRSLTPLSTPLQGGFGFFRHLTPCPRQHALRLACPGEDGCCLGRRHEVTPFRVFDDSCFRSSVTFAFVPAKGSDISLPARWWTT